MQDLQRGSSPRARARRLLLVGIMGVLSACGSDALEDPNEEPAASGDRDASVLHLPGEGVDSTPTSDQSSQTTRTARTEQINSALDEVRGALTGSPETAPADAGTQGAGTQDAGSADASSADAGSTDAGTRDTRGDASAPRDAG